MYRNSAPDGVLVSSDVLFFFSNTSSINMNLAVYIYSAMNMDRKNQSMSSMDLYLIVYFTELIVDISKKCLVFFFH